eukprot:1194068-Prorocentrum_lima.AAC.1
MVRICGSRLGSVTKVGVVMRVVVALPASPAWMSLRSLDMTVCGVVRSAVVLGTYSDGSNRRSQCPAWYWVSRWRTTWV